MSLVPLVSVATEKAENVEEEIDEVEIEGQGSQNGDASRQGRVSGIAHRYALFGRSTHGFDFLSVVCREPYEDEDTDVSNDGIQCGVCPEDVDDTGDDKADKPHHEDAAEAREVAFGGSSENAHGSKGKCRSRKGLCDGTDAVGEEDAGKRQAVHRCIEKEERGSGCRREAVDASGDAEHKTEFYDEQYPDGGAVAIDELEHRRTADDEECSTSSDAQSGGHPHIDARHDVREGESACCGSGTGIAAAIIVVLNFDVVFHCY